MGWLYILGWASTNKKAGWSQSNQKSIEESRGEPQDVEVNLCDEGVEEKSGTMGAIIGTMVFSQQY